MYPRLRELFRNCSERSENPQSLLAEPHELSHIKKVVAVVSGKGGVGKSLVTSLLAVTLRRRGFRTAVLDADITGPSVPRIFGSRQKAKGSPLGIEPAESATGIKLMSVNLLLPDDTDPVIWRGPIVAGTVKQFWTDVLWGDVDFMFVDMPPGTGDVPLTVFQSLPVHGIVVVTSPQELVGMIVEKAVKMAEMMNVPVLGLVENMSYFRCPTAAGSTPYRREPYRRDRPALWNRVHRAAAHRSQAGRRCDSGLIELFEGNWLDTVADGIEKRPEA
jgi:Mrp family chromosome partitioning ATPase